MHCVCVCACLCTCVICKVCWQSWDTQTATATVRQSTVRGHKCHNPFIIATSSWNANRKTKGFRSRIKNLGKTTRRIKQMRRISILWALRRGGEGTLLWGQVAEVKGKRKLGPGASAAAAACAAAFDSLQTASNSTRSTRARSKLNEQDTTRQDLQGRCPGQGELLLLLLLFVCAHWACRSAAPDRQSL